LREETYTGFISQIQCKQRSMTAAVLFRGLIADDKEMICWNRNLISIFYVYL